MGQASRVNLGRGAALANPKPDARARDGGLHIHQFEYMLFAAGSTERYAMFGFPRAGAAQTGHMTGAQAVARHDRGELVVIDVRDITELKATGTAAGGLHIPLMLLSSRADPDHPEHDPALSPDQPVALFCASGARSGMGADLLRRLGYREVYNLGGFFDWQAGGGKVRRV
jgi:rhodanese-related sulfurtransferase